MLYLVSQIFHLADKPTECHSFFCLDRPVSTVQWPPVFKFLNILQHNHPRANHCRPAERYPRKPTDSLVLGFTAFSLREMFAVRREPRQSHWVTVTRFFGIYIPDGFAVMFGIWVICLVHSYRFRVMVNSNVHAPSCRELNSGAGSPTAREIIYNQFSVNHGITSVKFQFYFTPIKSNSVGASTSSSAACRYPTPSRK